MSKRILVSVVGALLYVMSLNLFLTNAHVYAVGLTGIVQLVAQLLKVVHINLDLGVLLTVFNIPLFIFGFRKFGLKYVSLSFLTVVLSIIAVFLIPTTRIVSDRLTNILVGSVLLGTSVGICFNSGFSTGGTDVVLSYIQSRFGIKIGVTSNYLNGAVLLVTAFAFGFSQAIYSVIGMVITSVVMNYVYTYQNDAFITIFTKRSCEMFDLLNKNSHGVTSMLGRGQYTGDPTTVLFTIIQKKQIKDFIAIVKSIDSNALISIEDTSIVGHYVRSDRIAADLSQGYMKNTGD